MGPQCPRGILLTLSKSPPLLSCSEPELPSSERGPGAGHWTPLSRGLSEKVAPGAGTRAPGKSPGLRVRGAQALWALLGQPDRPSGHTQDRSLQVRARSPREAGPAPPALTSTPRSELSSLPPQTSVPCETWPASAVPERGHVRSPHTEPPPACLSPWRTRARNSLLPLRANGASDRLTARAALRGGRGPW